ncbi:Y-family DNA polymerase [Marinivivus vitaminiproducens]|uniref:Y-family DNA polymerase n=1 Tax=Marinivivus vitaminiproducens TaxID=3035935 RepID=UPI0027A028D7|nr:hypothetical protein P4R82_16905 [Geminicoccaceae bacterium SCSIO 64248]
MRKPEGVERLYVDFDSFFASAEQHLRPELRGRPVGVVPLDSEGTSIIAASREAKRIGIATHTSVRDAKAICPDIALVTARHDVYVRLHAAIRDAIDDVLPVAGVRSIDEMVCRLASNEAPRALDIGRTIKARLAATFSPVLTGSVGIGPNELLAKIAAEMEKPDGLVQLHPNDLPGRLLGLKLRDLPGVAKGIEARLARAGVVDMHGLWALPPKHARRIWGSVEGERFWALLHGYALERPATERAMFGHGRILPRGWQTPVRNRDCARLLLGKAARRLRREGFRARALTLGLRGRDGERWQAEERFAPVRDDRALLIRLDTLFARARSDDRAPFPAMALQVSLHGLVPDGQAPSDLFDTDKDVRARERWERLSEIADALHRRHGREMVTLGPQVELPGGYAGAKIAFGRIPDALDF